MIKVLNIVTKDGELIASIEVNLNSGDTHAIIKDGFDVIEGE